MSVPRLGLLPAIVGAERTGPEGTRLHRSSPMTSVTGGM
jgi:hypothetical protein